MRTPIVAGNWKLNGTRASARSLAQSIVDGLPQLHGALRVIVCPTFVHLGEVADVAAGTQLVVGAQDAADQQSGAFTGEVAAGMENAAKQALLARRTQLSALQSMASALREEMAYDRALKGDYHP